MPRNGRACCERALEICIYIVRSNCYLLLLKRRAHWLLILPYSNRETRIIGWTYDSMKNEMERQELVDRMSSIARCSCLKKSRLQIRFQVGQTPGSAVLPIYCSLVLYYVLRYLNVGLSPFSLAMGRRSRPWNLLRESA